MSSTLRSQASVLTKVGVDDTRTYGWNDLVGTTTTDLGTFEVRLLASVDYESGNGPFFGFLTLTAANGDRIAMRMDGDAKVRDDGSTTVVSALKVIDGSGQYVGSAGTGRFIGSRAAQLGSPVEIELTLDLER